MKKDLKELLVSAEEDIEVAKECLINRHYRHVCFLCQQSVEKLLKAYLLKKTGKYPFTHSITYLLEECVAQDKEFTYLKEIKIDILDDYYTETRYPPMSEISEEEAEEAVEIAERVREFVRERI